jgi:hypothetical protein
MKYRMYVDEVGNPDLEILQKKYYQHGGRIFGKKFI